MITVRGLLAVALIGGLFVLTLWDVALPKDNGQWKNVDPEIREWFRSQRNKIGSLCCDESDGFSLTEKEWRVGSFGGYEVLLDGRWYEVPPHAVLTGENKFGGAIVWVTAGHIFCFFPGALG
jgi:hypothetical protein